MCSKLAIFVATTMAIFVAANPAGTDGINNSCNSGPVQCCNSVSEADSKQADFFKSLLNVAIPIGTKIGSTCSPISAVGVGSGSSCQSQPVCCENNHFNGLVAIGCSPINLNI
ncbi:fungal hydrophobin-domain-containing protein [Crepidotus variabilis]|uniref:Hydrophobin n=1 Tax=Crepidotus variabilis TaxID=179855 RepID=A0A9P6EM27_9AGAR|nr:fungal hydrophobin-domain-containing protein [Crepidotus variabilis]